MIDSSLPQLTIHGLALLLGEDKIAVSKELNINTEPDIDEMIEEIEEEK